MGRYKDTPTQTVIRLANKGDKDACMELFLRYSTGTALLEKNPSKAEYWRKQSLVDHQEMFFTTQNYTSMTTKETSTMENIPENKKYDWAITPDRNKHKYVIGIDFGHGETSAAYCNIEWDSPASNLSSVKSLPMGGRKKVMPSAICISKDNQAFIGEVAFDSQNLNSSQTNVCFKKRPTDIQGKNESLMIRFMHEVYKKICAENPVKFTNGNHLVYIATPSGWKEHDKYLYGLMAKEAGIPIGGIISESRAALFKAKDDVASGLPQFIDKGVIVFDMGSSTLDFSYLQGSNHPIDDGYDCGASFVEKSMYEDKKKECDIISLFENKYPNLKDALLYKVREIKETYYNSFINRKCVRSINFNELVDGDEDFEDATIKFTIKSDDLKKSLEKKHYIDRIRKAMLDFKEKLNGKPIHGVFLTGGASRMDFIMPLVEECWGISENAIPKDTDPSLTISEGIALAARADIRSGGVGNIKKEIAELTDGSETKIYNLFATSLVKKIYSEVRNTLRVCITQFKNQDKDVSLNDLELNINNSIENKMNYIGIWAEECYQKAFKQETAELRKRLEKKVSNYSQQTITMQEGHVSLPSLPNLDTSAISEQIRDISTDLMDSGLLKDIIAGITEVASAIFTLLKKYLFWILIPYPFLTTFFGEDNDSEEKKKQKVRMKILNKKSRQEVYDHFETHWNEITSQILSSVQNAIYSNYELQTTIKSQSKKIIWDYAKKCLILTRSMID